VVVSGGHTHSEGVVSDRGGCRRSLRVWEDTGKAKPTTNKKKKTPLGCWGKCSVSHSVRKKNETLGVAGGDQGARLWGGGAGSNEKKKTNGKG